MKTRNYKPTEEQKQAARAKRAALIARTVPLQIARKSGLLPWAALENVNACLRLIYTQETGQSEWNTFAGWREQGRKVQKGAKGFPVWGRPLGKEQPEHAEAVPEMATPEESEAARGLSFFPLAYLFHAGQVDGTAANDAAENSTQADPLADAVAESFALSAE